MSQSKCDCPLAGYCERHKMTKPEQLWRLCQNDERYREVWDAMARGEKVEASRPNLLQRIVNFGAAVVSHVADGLARVDDETLKSRLALCNACDQNPNQCGTCSACGCPVAVKATWRSQDCPLGLWPKQERVGGGGCGGCPK